MHHFDKHIHHRRVHHKSAPMRGLLHACILCIIREKPAYGSEIHQKLKEKFNIEPPKPLVYTLLRRMERSGLIVSTWDIQESGPARRVYKITEEGIEHLRNMANRLKKIIPIIESIIKSIEES